MRLIRRTRIQTEVAKCTPAAARHQRNVIPLSRINPANSSTIKYAPNAFATASKAKR